jgi:hypothetical protein
MMSPSRLKVGVDARLNLFEQSGTSAASSSFSAALLPQALDAASMMGA